MVCMSIGNALNYHFSRRLYLLIHGIRGDVKFTGPCYKSVFTMNLIKDILFSQRLEDILQCTRLKYHDTFSAVLVFWVLMVCSLNRFFDFCDNNQIISTNEFYEGCFFN